MIITSTRTELQVAVNVDWFTYGASLLVFSDAVQGFTVETDQGLWQDYGMAPGRVGTGEHADVVNRGCPWARHGWGNHRSYG